MSIKRIFDIAISLIGIITLLPIYIIIAMLIKLDSHGSILFKQNRIGENGKLFKILKFRSMYSLQQNNSTVTVRGDSRITRVGKYLRRWKLDELPELINVLKGDMSFVGPRPDVPGYADRLIGDERRVLELRPGITGPATLKYSNEEEILAKVEDPIRYNNEVIFPDKTRINIEYLENMSLWTDIKIIFQTVFRRNY